MHSDQHLSAPKTPPFSIDFQGGFSSENLNENDSRGFGSRHERRVRSKTTLRLRYEAEITVLKQKLGNLEDIREKLGLSKRKICQLLLVDPSAWTRWTRVGEDAPPHIYRALQWYLALQEKYPALDVNFWLQTVAQINEKEVFAPKEEVKEVRREFESFKDVSSRQVDAFAQEWGAKIEMYQIEQKKMRNRLAGLIFCNLALAGALAAFLLVLLF